MAAGRGLPQAAAGLDSQLGFVSCELAPGSGQQEREGRAAAGAAPGQLEPAKVRLPARVVCECHTAAPTRHDGVNPLGRCLLGLVVAIIDGDDVQKMIRWVKIFGNRMPQFCEVVMTNRAEGAGPSVRRELVASGCRRAENLEAGGAANAPGLAKINGMPTSQETKRVNHLSWGAGTYYC